jgi:fatty acid desaturase
MQAAITKEDYFALRAKLSFQRELWPTALIMLADLGLLAAAFYFVSLGNWPAYILAQLIFVLVFFHNFTILHEAGHGNCSSDERVNTLIGYYASVFCFMPYFPWKYIHAEHHTWAGNVHKDPTLRIVRDYEESQRAKNWLIRVAWRTWLPVLALLQHVVFWSYPLVLLKDGRLHGKRLRRSVFSVGLLVVVYTFMYLAFADSIHVATFAPALILYLVVTELINLPHHMGTQLFENSERGGKLPVWEHNEVTRSCYYPRGLSGLLFLNFNFHIEHHLFPDLPWYRLRQARDFARTALKEEYCETIGINWNLQNRTKDATQVFLKDAHDGRSHWSLETRFANVSKPADELARYDDFLRDVRLSPDSTGSNRS